MNKKKTPEIVKRIQNTKLNEVDYKYQKSISYSQISAYYQCCYKWKLTYMDGLYEFKHNIHSVFGSAMHEVVQEYLNVMYNQSKVKANELNLGSLLEDKLRDVYKDSYNKNKKTHFSNPDELKEFYTDGYEILNFLKKNIGKYFSKRGWYLVGIEVPLLYPINYKYPNILFKGYVDVILYNEKSGRFILYDLKTSTRGWKDFKKKDEDTQFQLILYKHIFSQLFQIKPQDIDVEFLILKRKIPDESILEDYPLAGRRLQSVKVISGKNKTNKALKYVNNFMENVLDPDGEYKHKEYVKNDSNCDWCTFKNTKYCNNKTIITF